jgi:hypothetical protein
MPRHSKNEFDSDREVNMHLAQKTLKAAEDYLLRP